jgi:hypothetical protein
MTNVFYADAIDANRRGELTDAQRRNFRAEANADRRSALGLAAVFLAIAVLVGVFASATAPPVTRAVITIVSVLLTAIIGLRAIFGLDALTRDVRAGRVRSIEGAIGKRGSLVLRRNPGNTKVIQVGNQRFQVGPSRYQQLPDAGDVRLYYLPRSRKFVNLERIERAPAPGLDSVQGMVESLGALARAHGVQQRDEIRARMADAMDSASVGFTGSAPVASRQPPDREALATQLVGSWSNGFMAVTFRRDGTVTARIGGIEREGTWSVDASGRLSSNITGEQELADASISGDQLTVAQKGTGFKLRRSTIAD